MRIGTALGALLGAAVLAWLLHLYGWAPVADLLRRAGWRIVPVILFHVVQIVLSAAAWQAIAGPAAPRFSLKLYTGLRWIREGVNAMLPVAQVGGDVVAIRLLRRRGMPLARAVASCVADVTVEFVTQAAFTVLGLAVLFALVSDARARLAALGAAGLATGAATGLVFAQRLGLAGVVERGILHMAQAAGWDRADGIAGLHGTLMRLYRQRRQLAQAAFWHGLSWVAGAGEVWLALRALGHPVGLGAAVVIESLGQAVRSSGFAVPGAIGIQEGGLVAVCSLFGLTPDVAIALSLIKRLREVVLGLPSLPAWLRWEASRPATAQAGR